MNSSDNPADAGTRRICAKSLRDSPWLTGSSFLKTSYWPFVPPTDVKFKLKAKTTDLYGTNYTTFETETAISATVVSIASTLEWQKYSSYEKLLRVVAYALRLLPQNEGYRSISGSVTDPQELENAQGRLFYLVQHEFFPTEKTSLLKGSPLNSTSKILQFFPFIGPPVERNDSKCPTLMSNTQFYSTADILSPGIS